MNFVLPQVWREEGSRWNNDDAIEKAISELPINWSDLEINNTKEHIKNSLSENGFVLIFSSQGFYYISNTDHPLSQKVAKINSQIIISKFDVMSSEILDGGSSVYISYKLKENFPNGSCAHRALVKALEEEFITQLQCSN